MKFKIKNKSNRGCAVVEAVIIVLAIVMLIVIGIAMGSSYQKDIAISNNVGKYIINPTNGVTSFVWYSNTNKW